MNTRMMAAVVVLASFVGRDAEADRSPGYLRFDQLSATLVGNQVIVDYDVGDRAWMRMQERGIQPRFRFEATVNGMPQVTRMTINHERGQATVPVHGFLEEFEVDVGGRNTGLRGLKLNGTRLESVSLSVNGADTGRRRRTERGTHGGGRSAVNRAADPRVIDQCGFSMSGQANEIACMDAVQFAAFDPVNLIQSCDFAMTGDENELRCIQIGSRSVSFLEENLRSCDFAMTGDDNELSCFASVSGARRDVSALINKCDFAMTGDQAELECIRRSVAF